MADLITSRDNPWLKGLRRLAQDNQAYRKLGEVWLEGEHLVDAVVRHDHPVRTLVCAESHWATLPTLWQSLGERQVLLPDALFKAISEWRTPEGQARLRPMIPLLNSGAIERDARAAAAWLDKQVVVNVKRGIGTAGYCMGGPFTVRTAHAVPGRVRAAASFHGASLVTGKPDSPHLLLKATKASYLFAIARNDDARAPGDKDALREAAKAAGRAAEVEVYPADHGWCTIDAPVYEKVQAERAWARMLALFRTL